MSSGEGLRKTTREKNYESPFDALEKDFRYVSAVYLAREAGAQEPHIVSLLQKMGIPIERKEAVAQRAHFVSGSRDGYHSFLQKAFTSVPAEQQAEMRTVVDLFMRAEAPEKYWRYEVGARVIAYTLIHAGMPLPVVSSALTRHLGGAVKSTTIREVLKHVGRETLLEQLSQGIESSIAETDATLLVETARRMARNEKRESIRYRSQWNKDKRCRAYVLRLGEGGMSPQGIALAVRKTFRIKVPVVTIKFFVRSHPPFPHLDERDRAWVEEKLTGAHEAYAETKRRHYKRGASLRLERTLTGDALTRYTEAKLKQIQKEEAALYSEYAPRLRRFAMKLDPRRAEDMTQESFVRLFTHLRNNSLELWSHVSPFQLLATICKNLVRDAARRPITKNTISNDEIIDRFESPTQSTDELVSEHLAALEVRSALLALPEELQVIAKLKYLEGLTESEVSHILSIPLGTVKSRWRAAATLLRERLKDYNDFD